MAGVTDIGSRDRVADVAVSPNQALSTTHIALVTCSLCNNISTSPMEDATTDKIFCEPCITAKLREEPSDPRYPQTLADLRPSRLARSMSAGIPIDCCHAPRHTNGRGKCGWTGTVSEFAPHMREAHTKVACPCCGVLLLPQEATAHDRDAAGAHAAAALRDAQALALAAEALRRDLAAQEELLRSQQKPVWVEWVIQRALALRGEVNSKRVVVGWSDGRRQPIHLNLNAVFTKEYVGLYIRNDGSDSGYNGTVCLDGATITLKGRKASDNIVKKFQAEDRPPANMSVGFTRVATNTDIERLYVAADGSITVLASLCAQAFVSV